MLKKGVVLVRKLILCFTFMSFITSGAQAGSDKDNSIKPFMQKLKSMKLRTLTVGDKVTHYMDFNRNGRADAEYMYIGGKLFSEKIDLNNDGKWDKSVWYYQEGKVLKSSTLDTNLDGKVDVKIVETVEGAKPGFFIKKVYLDKDYDGRFDSKKTIEVDNHQAAGANAPGHNHCINCETRAMEQAHYPAVLDQKTEDTLFDLMDRVRNNSLIDDMYSRPGLGGELGYTFNLQKECSSSNEHKDLINRTNITQGLRKGLSCLQKLATPNATNIGNISGIDRYGIATHNLYKSVAGLVGYDYFSSDNFVPHGQYLSFVCKAPNVPGLFAASSNMMQQYDSGAQAQMRTVMARATIQRPGGLNSHVNRLSGQGFSAPNIAFNPNLSTELKKQPQDYSGEDINKKMQKLIFHEFLHTSLGTEHSPNENAGIYDSVDYADTCADYCFNNPAGGDAIGREIKRISGEICGGNFVTPNAAYKAKKGRLKCLKEQHLKYKNKNITPDVGVICPSETPLSM